MLLHESRKGTAVWLPSSLAMIATRLHAKRHSSLTAARSSVASIHNSSHLHHHQHQRRKASKGPSGDVPNIDSDDHEDDDEDDDDQQQPHSKVEIFLISSISAKSSLLRSASVKNNPSILLLFLSSLSFANWQHKWVCFRQLYFASCIHGHFIENFFGIR